MNSSESPSPGTGPAAPMPTPTPTPAQVRSARIQIVLMVLIFAAPVVLSYIWYFFVHPVDGHAYGTLLDVHPLPAATLSGLDGQPVSLESLRGKWLLVAEDSGACDTRCQDKLYAMRQVRAALGHDDLRVERVLLLQDGEIPAAALQQDYPGTHFLRLQGSPLVDAFPPAAGDPRAHLWLVDPLGNLVMRYPADADLKRLLKDLERLLKASQIG